MPGHQKKNADRQNKLWRKERESFRENADREKERVVERERTKKKCAKREREREKEREQGIRTEGEQNKTERKST